MKFQSAVIVEGDARSVIASTARARVALMRWRIYGHLICYVAAATCVPRLRVCALACACDKKVIHMSGPGVWLQGGACLHLASSYLLIFVPMCECCVCAFLLQGATEREGEAEGERGGVGDSAAHESLFIRAAA